MGRPKGPGVGARGDNEDDDDDDDSNSDDLMTMGRLICFFLMCVCVVGMYCFSASFAGFDAEE